MEDKKGHYRHLMLFYYRKGKTASQTKIKICAVYGEDAVSNRVYQKWFSRFKIGNVSLKDKPRIGRPVVADVDKIKDYISSNPRTTTREMAQELNISRIQALKEA
ncbi:hypothetical protein ANN_14586 [Periplaneta americana]|uniref:Mos1 transposase HTH domain-containing protein n=1 Tax=Periplaneta americana TaxID=6978 RepID=A0ABQ8SWR6_PERAM|nr:hypothetical protein ANN_14586 [Periplaneta americana]